MGIMVSASSRVGVVQSIGYLPGDVIPAGWQNLRACLPGQPAHEKQHIKNSTGCTPPPATKKRRILDILCRKNRKNGGDQDIFIRQ
jgi:hypothetical protein